MRQIGTLSRAEDAQRFAAWLVTQNIAAHVDAEDGQWAIWVRNEDQVADARQALAQFEQSPHDPKYRDAEAQAARIEQEERQQRERAKRNLIDMRSNWRSRSGRGGFRAAPLTWTLIALSFFVGILTNVNEGPITPTRQYLAFAQLERDPMSGRWTYPTTPTGEIDGFRQIRQGQVWRLVTPIFLHFGWIHLIFNMLMLHAMGRRIEPRYGAWRMALLVLLVAVLSNVAQYLLEGTAVANGLFIRNPNFGGMSGVVYGLFGFAWMKSLFDPQAGITVEAGTVFILLAWMFLNMVAALPAASSLLSGMPRVANTAHFVGLAVGMGASLLPLAWRRR